MCYMYLMEYYLLVKDDKTMKSEGKYIELNNFILSEIIQPPQNDKSSLSYKNLSFK